MPIYDYFCHNCGKRVEVWLRSQGDPALCPACGRLLQDRLLSAPHMVRAESQRPPGRTCCGREERCDSPPCSADEGCRRM